MGRHGPNFAGDKSMRRVQPVGNQPLVVVVERQALLLSSARKMLPFARLLGGQSIFQRLMWRSIRRM
jgi:hypothetical protein